MTEPQLLYFADPMCSWCYGFSPVIDAISEAFGEGLPIRLVLGGLRPGTTEPMSATARRDIRGHWEHVQAASGQAFDFGFFDRERFVYDTEPGCRAVVIMRRAGAAAALAGLRAVHAAFYAGNRDVTDADVLTGIAAGLGHDPAAFRATFDTEAAREETARDFALTQNSGVRGFPTLIAGDGQGGPWRMVTNGFQPAAQVVPALRAWRDQMA